MRVSSSPQWNKSQENDGASSSRDLALLGFGSKMHKGYQRIYYAFSSGDFGVSATSNGVCVCATSEQM